MRSLILLLLIFAANCSAQAAFESNQVRYLAPYDLFKTLNLLLPLSSSAKKEMPPHCLELSPANRAVIGDNQPTTGRPALSQPSGGFVRWYAMCLTLYIDHSTQDARQAFATSPLAVRELFGEDMITLLQSKDAKVKSPLVFDQAWNSLARDSRTTLLTYQLRRLIGPEVVLTSFCHVHSDKELIQLIETSLTNSQPNLTVAAALQKAIFFLAMRDEFLSY